MNELLNLEQRSFKTFSIFSFFSLLALITFLSIFSSKYTVTDINYEKDIDLNYNSFDFVKGKSIWFINESDFGQFYEDNLSVESLVISKQLPNLIFIDIAIHEKIIVISDLRDTNPKEASYIKIYIQSSQNQITACHV